MSDYGYVENNEVKQGPCALPRVWNNISNFDLMTPAKLPALGWLPWVIQTTPGEVLDRTTIEIKGNQIVQTHYMRDRTQTEKDIQLQRTIDQLRRQRQAAYTKESDPLFMKWQRGDVTKEEWVAKVDEIKARFPYPTAQ